MNSPLLSILLLVPLVAGIGVACAPERSAKAFGVFSTAVTFLLSLGLLFYDDPGKLDQSLVWLPELRVRFHLGVDTVSIYLLLLTTFLHLMAALFAGQVVADRRRTFFSLLLLLEATVIGAFTALDTVLFYVFFEACLVPAYFLIGIFGGYRRVQAATKFFVYTVVGSLLMLASIIGLYLTAGSFDVSEIQQTVLSGGGIPIGTAMLLMGGFAVAFAVKTGLFPFHTWLPDTYAEAPPVVTALLSGVLAKLGTYGFYRFCLQLFPEASARFAPFLVALGVVSIVYGALVAAVQTDARRTIAYSSVSHLGFVIAGLFSLTREGLSGAVLQMVNHGITSGALFLILGMILARRGTTKIVSLGGLWEQMPVFGRVFLIVTLSAVALPLTNGFVGEFLILLGTFQTFPWLGAIATTGVIWSAVYMLWMFQRVMYGPVDRPENRRLRDISPAELGIMLPFIALIFLLGILPAPAQKRLDADVNRTLERVGRPVRPVESVPVAAADR